MIQTRLPVIIPKVWAGRAGVVFSGYLTMLWCRVRLTRWNSEKCQYTSGLSAVLWTVPLVSWHWQSKAYQL